MVARGGTPARACVERGNRRSGADAMFFTWGESQGWGFKVGGRIVPWREYLGVDA